MKIKNTHTHPEKSKSVSPIENLESSDEFSDESLASNAPLNIDESLEKNIQKTIKRKVDSEIGGEPKRKKDRASNLTPDHQTLTENQQWRAWADEARNGQYSLLKSVVYKVGKHWKEQLAG